MPKSHSELHVWNRAIAMNLSIYRLTATLPKTEIYGLVSQLRRASVSVASNIAEGYGRGSRGEYKQFLAIARGSNLEVQTQLVISRQLDYGNPEELENAGRLCDEVNKMLYALIRKL